ncbi:uncharacterized protein NECHADRAFT_88535 [Fusarium vanettenii 77-13-4]|uniref:Uncharacterized protein n=1 Tax=Fusarium vanettenii (strain ATCC MYA-4622 / CBS 123669 / FGSC 9596 / NRRL 45880 / 77-13-4) TaxID=660122 RepID=C7ZQX2_FUSV7|nr:uncharacterized protein NECHADRAFT_88535 [Fusarium vanettenii 77-13-4]EEU33584.1 predicted protein [Fusarium vanettenii 77-13-4]
MPTPGPKKRRLNAVDDVNAQELARLPKKGAALAEQIKSTCGKYPWDIAEGFEPLTWGINLLEDIRALVNLARGTVTINQVRGELQRLAGLHERTDRVNKLMKADVVATKTWVAEKIKRAETESPEPSDKDEDKDGNTSHRENTTADDTSVGDQPVISPPDAEAGPIVGGGKENEQGHEEYHARPNDEPIGKQVQMNADDQYLNTQTPIRPIGDIDTTKSMEKQVNSGMAVARKHSLPATSPLSAAKRQKTVNGIAKLNKLQPRSSFQTNAEDEQIMDSFTMWLNKKATDFATLSENSRVRRGSIEMRYKEAMEEASGARGQQVTEQGLKQSAEARLKAIKEDQTKETAALAQLLSLQQSHSGVIGDDLTAVIKKMEAKIKTSKEDLENAEKDTAARVRFLDKLSKSIETADNNAARLKQESEHLSRDLDEVKKKVNLSSTANMFFKYGLDRTIEALEEDFGDMKDWVERKIAGESRNI